MERILIVRLGAMGDILHAVPAVIAIHRALPDTEISWMVEHRWQDLLPSFVDPLLVDTKAWRKHPLASVTRESIGGIRDHERFDLAIDFQGSTKSAVLGWLAPADLLLGPADPREWPARFFYGGMIETHSAHVIDQAFEIASAAIERELVGSRPAHNWDMTAGHASVAPTDPFPRNAKLESWAQQFGNKKIALLTPGAGWQAKQWPAKKFGELAKQLSSFGYSVFVNIGPSEEPIGSEVIEASGGSAQTISCSIAQLIALTRRASLFVGGDTGPTHLAAMLSVPTVALFGPTDPRRNGPYYPRTTALRSRRSHTSYSHAHSPDPGLQSITVDEVLAAIEQVSA
jgi:heptosyltransferase-1